MTFTTIKKLDKQTRSALLASVASHFLPTALSSDERKLLTIQQQELLNEIHNRFGIVGDNYSEAALRAIRKMLMDELRATLIEKSEIKSVRERVGQKGLLRSDLYEITFNKPFLELSVSMGVSKGLAEDCIAHATEVEHLFPEEKGLTAVDSHSLFAMEHPKYSRCAVLVLAIRKFAKLYVDGAWLIFYDDVGVSKIGSPVELLKAFAQRYGKDLIVGDVRSRFVLSETIKATEAGASVLHVDNEEAELIDTRFSFIQSLGVMQIALAFSVRIKDYISDLKRHGVSVSRSIPSGATSPNYPSNRSPG